MKDIIELINDTNDTNYAVENSILLDCINRLENVELYNILRFSTKGSGKA